MAASFRDLVINIGHNHKPRAPWLLNEGPDQPIPEKEHTMAVALAKPIKPGFRRPLTLTPDEELDAMAGGVFATSEVIQGDSTFAVDVSSTAKSIKAWAYGDGATGEKVARIHADGHIGPEEAAITLDISWTVAHPDATAFGPVVEGPDEPIPAPPVA